MAATNVIHMYVCTYICMYVCMLNKNTLGVKKVRGQSEATCKQAGAYKGGQVTKPIVKNIL